MKYNQLIDHTILKPDAKKEQIIQLCKEANDYSFASVCVNPFWVKLCAKELENSSVKVCTVIGFPLGASTKEVKAFETENAISNGADEIDMVINIGALKDGDDQTVLADIEAVVKAAKGNCVKVILETCLLTKEEIKKACELCVQAKATFVKTSTGFSTGGATVEDVKLMKDTVQDHCEVKASGGVRSFEEMEAVIAVGATRIGTSSGISLVSGKKVEKDY